MAFPSQMLEIIGPRDKGGIAPDALEYTTGTIVPVVQKVLAIPDQVSAANVAGPPRSVDARAPCHVRLERLLAQKKFSTITAYNVRLQEKLLCNYTFITEHFDLSSVEDEAILSSPP